MDIQLKSYCFIYKQSVKKVLFCRELKVRIARTAIHPHPDRWQSLKVSMYHTGDLFLTLSFRINSLQAV